MISRALPRALLRLAVVLLATSAGCHTMHFEISKQPHAQVVHQRNHYFLWGLVPHIDVDVREHCPYGASAVREEMTVVDGLCQLPTLGIWAPRSAYFYCLPGPAERPR